MRFSDFRAGMMAQLNAISARLSKSVTTIRGGNKEQLEKEHIHILRQLGRDPDIIRYRHKGVNGRKRKVNRLRLSRITKRRHKR